MILDTIRSTREKAIDEALFSRSLSLYSGAQLHCIPVVKGKWEGLERQGFKVMEVTVEVAI